MAIYHLSATIVQRSKGHSAVAAAAYRAGEQLRDQQIGVTHDYTRKGGVVQSEILAPEHAPQWVRDRQELWNQAELAEKRRDGQPAREIRVALPDEFTDEQRADLLFNFCHDAFVKRGMVADVSIHRPDRNGDQRNQHAHILLTMRELDGDQFSARKQRDWNQEETLKGWREMWCDYQNRALEKAGFDVRVDHRTLEAQGIDREPTTHLGKAATAMERRKQQSERGDQKRQVEAKNQTIDALKEELSEVDALIEAERIIADAQREGHEEQSTLSWEEEKALAQSAFSDPGDLNREMVGQNQKTESLVNELAEIDAQLATVIEAEFLQGLPAEEERVLTETMSNPLHLPDSALHEIRRIREIFHDVTGVSQSKGEASAARSPQEGKPAPFDLFSDPVVMAFEADIRERGEVTERGISNSWIARTVTIFENFYYDTIDYMKNTFGRLMGSRDNRPQPDRNLEMDDYEPDR